MKVPVIDNGGQWTHREWRVLRDLGADSRIVPNTTSLDELNADGVVLSGGALSLEGSTAPLGAVDDGSTASRSRARHLRRSPVPRTALRWPVARGGPEFGSVDLTVDRPDHPMFSGLPGALKVWASHNDQVVAASPRWTVLAHSVSCPVEAMAHPTRPIWSVQFHPEVEHTEGGREIFRHFLDVCRR